MVHYRFFSTLNRNITPCYVTGNAGSTYYIYNHLYYRHPFNYVLLNGYGFLHRWFDNFQSSDEAVFIITFTRFHILNCRGLLQLLSFYKLPRIHLFNLKVLTLTRHYIYINIKVNKLPTINKVLFIYSV